MRRGFALMLVLLVMSASVFAEPAENWLLCDVNEAGETGYFDFARVSEIEGYEFAGVQPGIMDQKLHYFVFTPVQEGAPAESVSVQMGKGEAAAVAGKIAEQIANFGELIYGGEVETFSTGGMTVHCVVIEYRMASYTEGEEYDYVQNAVVYVETPVAQRCVVLNAVNMGHDESAFSDREAMQALLLSAAEGIELAQ